MLELLQEGNDEDEVAVILRLGRPGAVPEGVRVVTQFGDIATVRLKRGAIPDVRGSAEVASMKAPEPLAPEPAIDPLDASENSPESVPWADDRRPHTEPATGCGVVVGVIDFGCDFAHPDFLHPDGRTRLLALWDQGAQPGSGASNRYGYGVIHTSEAIDRALATGDPYAALGYHPADSDPDQQGAHGTHVMSIAAGNGQGGGPAGVAPEADLVFVQHSSRFGREETQELGDSVTLLEAVDFIARTAGDRPWVINISMGRHGGQHDGLTLVEQGLDAALRAAPGRGMSQSAGNYYHRQCHTSGQLRPGEERTFFWEIEPIDVTPNELEVWYPGQDVLIVEVRSPDGTLSKRVALAERATLTLGGREVGNVYHRANEPNSLDHHINIFLYPGATAGSWEITLIAQDVADGRFHAWIERDALCPGCQSRFRPEDAVPSSTTGTIANAFRTISVGAYHPHSRDQEVAHFSSGGPTRDGRIKPDLVAPGVNILAARSAPREGHDGTPLVTRMTGTSMASPHVAGTLALMFEVAPRRLRIEETRNLLLTSTRKAPSQQEMANRMGSGYLDIDRAIEAARQGGSRGLWLKPENEVEQTRTNREETEVVSQVLDKEDLEEDRYYDLSDVGEGEPVSPERREYALPGEAMATNQPGAPWMKESTLMPREPIGTFSEHADRDNDPTLEHQIEEEELEVDDFDFLREGRAKLTDGEIPPEDQRPHPGQGSIAENELALEPTVSDIESSREWDSPFVEETDPATEIGDALWEKASTGVSVAIYDSDDAELTRRGVDWAKREGAIGLKTKKIEAAGLTFGKAIADSGNIISTLTDLGAALKAAVDKVPAPSGTRGVTPSLIRLLALFSHGWGTTLAIGGTINAKNVAKVIKGIAPVLTEDVKIVLYGCSVCRGVSERQSWHTTTMEPGGDDSLAARIRDALVDEGKTKASVWGHTEVGHTTTNWTLRTFYAADGKGTDGQSYAGQFVFESEKTKALEDLERAIGAEGYSVESSKRADFESFVSEILKAHMYDAYGAANLKKDKKSGNRVNNLTYNGINLSEMAPVYPNEVAEIIRTYWRDVYWSEDLKKSIAKEIIRRLAKLKVIRKDSGPKEAEGSVRVEDLAEKPQRDDVRGYEVSLTDLNVAREGGSPGHRDVTYVDSRFSPETAPSQHVILVAGYEYEAGYKPTRTSFEALCENRMKRLLKKDSTLKFTLFDFKSGVVKLSDVDAKGRRKWEEIKTFNPVTNDNYSKRTYSDGSTEWVFDKNQAGAMSITDAYKYIQEVGEREPGSVKELSIFSHGYYQGPILVNSYDEKEGEKERDENDKDGRHKKDFEPPNMSADDLKKFRKAFHKDGFSWIWGCAFTDSYRQVLNQLLKRRGPYKDVDSFRFDFDKKWAEEWFGSDIFFPARDATGEYPLSFERTFAEIKDFLARGLDDTYFKKLAVASGVKCYGALQGTYSTFEAVKDPITNKLKPAKLQLMLVPTNEDIYGVSFTRFIEFYKTYLGMAPAPEKRGYGTYVDVVSTSSSKGETTSVSEGFLEREGDETLDREVIADGQTELGSELVDLADEVVADRAAFVSSGALLGQVLSRAEVTETLDSLSWQSSHLSPAEIFDAFVSNRNPALRYYYEQLFEVVATPGSTLNGELCPGDLLMRRAFGEGDLAHVSFLVSGEAVPHQELVGRDWKLETNSRGRYAQVVEGGAFPHGLPQRFARRVTDEAGRLPYNQMILRTKAFTADRLASLESINSLSRWPDHTSADIQESASTPVNIYLKFEVWNGGAFKPVGAGVAVDVMDYNPLSSDKRLDTGHTNAQGEVSFSFPDLQTTAGEAPDIYFLVRSSSSTAGPTLPEKWSTKGWNATDGRAGYYPDFAGTNLGTSADPLLFRIGLDFHARLEYLNVRTGANEPAPKGVPVTLHAGHAKKTLRTDDKGEVHGVVFDAAEGGDTVYFRVDFEVEDPAINLGKAQVADRIRPSADSWNTSTNDADQKYYPQNTLTSIGQQGSPMILRCSLKGRNVALYFLKILRELSTFLFHITGGTSRAFIEGVTLLRTSVSGFPYSWPVGVVNIPPKDRKTGFSYHWDRGTIIH